VLPRYLETEFGAGRQALGLAVAALAVTSIAARPIMPWWMHRFGVRHLIATGSVVALASYVGNLAAGSIAMVCVLRGVAGIGESFHFVGSSAFINDRVDSTRRATATSYFSLSIFGGLAIGPIIGDELAQRAQFTTAFVVSALLCAVSAFLAAALPPAPVHDGHQTRSGPAIAINAIRPGLVLMAGMIGFTVWSTLITPYSDDVGGLSAGTLFAIYAGLLIVIRLTTASLPDRLGHRRSAGVCIVFMASGVAVLAVGAPTAVGTVLVALGMSLLYPAMSAHAVNSTSMANRPATISTFTAFFEIGSIVGAVVAGQVAASFSDRSAFGVAAALTIAGLIPLWSLVSPESTSTSEVAP
jgi:MFS family permease